MFKFIEKHPFISGFITGIIGVRIVSKKIKRLVRGIVILEIDKMDNDYKVPPSYSKYYKNEDNPSTETEPENKKEN